MSMEVPKDPSRRRMLSLGGLTALGVGTLPLLSACTARSDQATATAAGAVGPFVKTPSWKFVMVNHSTTNAFFTPTIYGMEDAAALLGVKAQWTGSETGSVAEMTRAVSTAINGGADGIAVSLIDPNAFTPLIAQAAKAGIPVIGYSSDAPGSGRLAYVGTDNAAAGSLMGQRVVELVSSGDIAMFLAQPTASYAIPRIQGLMDAAKAHGLHPHLAKSSFTINQSVSDVAAYVDGHPGLTGLFGLDANATQAVGQVVKQKGLKGKVVAGGYDALGPTLELLSQGYLSFTIDEQAYMQGFLPIVELFMTKMSGGQTGAVDANPGIKFVDQAGAALYTQNPSRFEGTTKAQKLVPASR
jgi:simple sugar transport system substrate-binding protein